MPLYHNIKGQTPLDEDEKLGLIPIVITREELNEHEQENILQARKWIMQTTTLRKQNVLTEKFLRLLHRRMFGHVWNWAGKYRSTNKNIGIEHREIRIELHKLLEDARYWIEHDTYSINDCAVIFHHRLVKIHLFSNGNGRHARMCADAFIAKYGGDRLRWGGHVNANNLDEIRKHYIEALRDADNGDYTALLKFANAS